MDYSRKFLEAASRYHELSWVAEIDEDERQHMLQVPPSSTDVRILITFQVCGSHMRRPRPRGSKQIPSSRFSM